VLMPGTVVLLYLAPQMMVLWYNPALACCRHAGLEQNVPRIAPSRLAARPQHARDRGLPGPLAGTGADRVGPLALLP
jgi:hypothetical protein